MHAYYATRSLCILQCGRLNAWATEPRIENSAWMRGNVGEMRTFSGEWSVGQIVGIVLDIPEMVLNRREEYWTRCTPWPIGY